MIVLSILISQDPVLAQPEITGTITTRDDSGIASFESPTGVQSSTQVPRHLARLKETILFNLARRAQFSNMEELSAAYTDLAKRLYGPASSEFADALIFVACVRYAAGNELQAKTDLDLAKSILTKGPASWTAEILRRDSLREASFFMYGKRKTSLNSWAARERISIAALHQTSAPEMMLLPLQQWAAYEPLAAYERMVSLLGECPTCRRSDIVLQIKGYVSDLKLTDPATAARIGSCMSSWDK